MKTISPCSKHICLHCYHEGWKCLPLAETLSDGDAIAVQHMHDYSMQSKTPPIDGWQYQFLYIMLAMSV